MRRTLVLGTLWLLSVIFVQGQTPTRLAECGLTPKIQETIATLRVYSAVLETLTEFHDLVEYTSGTVEDLRPLLDSYYSDILQAAPADDAWGNPIQIEVCSWGYAVISSGPDGVLHNLDYMEDSICRSSSLPRPIAFEDDLMIKNGGLFGNPLNPRIEHIRLTTLGLKALGTALNSYLSSHPTPADLDGPQLPSQIALLLEPSFFKSGESPTVDTWGTPLFIQIREGTPLVASFGCDGLPDTDYSDPSWLALRGPTDSPADDIVYFDSSFARWPRYWISRSGG